MIQLGEKQILKVIKEVEFGIYLAPEDAAGSDERVLLPIRQKPWGVRIDDLMQVFVYRDSSDRLIATTNEPALTLGKVARLRVVQVGRIGAFLDWGLEKDLLLPFKEQTRKVQEGEEVNAALYIDKSNRLCATMKIYPYLEKNSPYRRDDMVTGEIYEISANFGAFVAVDNRYSGLIPAKEMYGELKTGDTVEVRVTAVKPDGKLDLSVRQKAYLQIEIDAVAVMKVIRAYQGILPFTDKASPEVIREEMKMSKSEFKRAVGHLLKEGKIEITDQNIKIKKSDINSRSDKTSD